MNTKKFNQRMALWYQQCQAHDASQTDRLARWRNLEPESAQVLVQLLHAKQAKTVLEIGTSNGFSTAWIAYALAKQHGLLITIELDEVRSLLAQEQLKALDIHQNVEFLVADAKHVLAEFSQDVDVIFLDAERRFYSDYINDLKRLLKQKAGNTLVVDNVISHQHEVADFLQCFIDDEQYSCLTLNIGAGLFIATQL